MSDNQKTIRCKLDGRQSVTVPISLKIGGKHIEEDVTILVRGFLKFRDIQSTNSSVEDIEYQKESANFLDDKTIVYPVLFASKETVIKGGRGSITLLPRSEDLMQDTNDIEKRAVNFSIVTNQEILDTGIIKEDEELFKLSNNDAAVIIIETGTERTPYKVSVEITIIDNKYFGQTIDRGTIEKEEIVSDTGVRTRTSQSSNFIVDFYNDEDWIPVVDNILDENNATDTEVLNEISVLENSTPFGASTMYDAVVSASNTLSEDAVNDTRKIVYVFTDNDINTSIATVDDAVEAINEIDGDKRVPVLIGNLAIVDPITLSVRANISDTENINKLSFLTGGQSVTVFTEDFIDDVISIFYSEAVGALGYGTFDFTIDLKETVSLETILPFFELPDEDRTSISWTISISTDGYNFTDLNNSYTSNQIAVEFNELQTRYIKFSVTFITGFSLSDISEYNPPFLSPVLYSFEISYNKSETVYLFLNLKDSEIVPSQMTVAVNANDVDPDQIKVGLAKSDAINWDDYETESQPTVYQNGKIVVPIRYSTERDEFDNETLSKTGKFTLKAKYGSWDPFSSITVYDKQNNLVSSESYRGYPRLGIIVVDSILPLDYKAGDYRLSVLNQNNYKVGLELLNQSTIDSLEIYGIGYMYTTGKELLPPVEKIPPEAEDVTVSPDVLSMYSKISLSYDYFDTNFDKEDISQTEIKWYINDVHIEYLDGLREWNDITNPNDPLFRQVFSFSASDLEQGETIEDRARTLGESILKVGDKIYSIIRVSDGDLLGSLSKSNVIIVAESKPLVYQIEIVGINPDSSETTRLSSGIPAQVKFNFYSDTGINKSEIIWWTDGSIFKKGVYNQTDENGLSYSRIEPGEYGLGTTAELGLVEGREIFVQIIPKSDRSVGDTTTSDTYIINNALPYVVPNTLTLDPPEPNTNQELILRWEFYDFEVHALQDGEQGIQNDFTRIEWQVKLFNTDQWIPVYKDIEGQAQPQIATGYEESWFANENRRTAGQSSFIVSPLATRVGDSWRVFVTPNDSIDDGETIESKTIAIRSSSN